MTLRSTYRYLFSVKLLGLQMRAITLKPPSQIRTGPVRRVKEQQSYLFSHRAVVHTRAKRQTFSLTVRAPGVICNKDFNRNPFQDIVGIHSLFC